MTRPYSEDLPERALARLAARETIRQIGKALPVDINQFLESNQHD
jgi:hypothetical protein